MKDEEFDSLLSEIAKDETTLERKVEIVDRLKNDRKESSDKYQELVSNTAKLQEDYKSLQAKKVDEFFNLVDNHKGKWKIGFDSCCVPGIINKTKNIAEESIDTCEAARFSCYITHDMKMIPCSFDNQDMKYAVDLRKHTIEEAWNSEQFMQFRATLLLSCLDCKSRNICMGGCPLRRQIVLCDRKEKDFA